MTSESLLEIKRAAFGYEGRAVIGDVDLRIASGDFIGIIGENGSGKSTLLRGLLGLLPPLKGKVRRSPELGRALGWVPQRDFIDPVLPLTTLDMPLLGRSLVKPWHARMTREDMEISLRCLEAVGLSDMADTPLQSLSGGQRQRALIARALAVNPKILVLDEPTTGIDAAAASSILDLLTDFNRRKKLAIVMVTHHREHLHGAATRVVSVENGRATEAAL